MNNVLNQNIIIFLFCYYCYKAKKLECQEKIIIIKKIANVDNNEENVNKKIILHDDEHDDKNINLDGVN